MIFIADNKYIFLNWVETKINTKRVVFLKQYYIEGSLMLKEMDWFETNEEENTKMMWDEISTPLIALLSTILQMSL